MRLFPCSYCLFVCSPSDEFYSLFYLGLFAEARNEPGKAAEYMKRAVRTRYATDFGRGDYMTSVARVRVVLWGDLEGVDKHS